METQKEVEIVKKFPDIFSDKILLENANKKREIQDRFRAIAKKVFMKPHENEFPFLKLEPTVSTPVHHHLVHRCPEQWIHHHEHEHHHEHHNHHLHHATLQGHHGAPTDPQYSVADLAMMAMKFKHNQDGGQVVHHTDLPMDQISEKDDEVSVKPSEDNRDAAPKPEENIIAGGSNEQQASKPSQTTEGKPATMTEEKENDDLNNSREVNLPKSDSHSQAGSDTAFEDDPATLIGQLSSKRSHVKMNENNLEEIKSMLGRGVMSLGITLLKRLRKYKLISSTIEHDGKIIVGISPRVVGRVKDIASG